jgi:hypothetical protein
VLVRLSGLKRVLVNTNNHGESNTRDTRFYPMVRPSNTCLLPRCGVPMDEGCTQPLSSDPMINLNTTVFHLENCSRLRGIYTNWSLSPLQRRSQRKHGVRLGEATHARLKYAAHPRTRVKTRAQMTTQGVRDSNGAQFSNTTKRMRRSRVWMP